MSETHAACHVTEMLQRCCGFLWILGACSWWIRALLCVWFRLIKQCAGMHNGTQLPMLPAGSACMQRSACTAWQQREVWLWRVPVCSATLDCVPPACLAGAQHSNQARLHTVGEQAGGVRCTGMPLGLDITYTHQKIFFFGFTYHVLYRTTVRQVVQVARNAISFRAAASFPSCG